MLKGLSFVFLFSLCVIIFIPMEARSATTTYEDVTGRKALPIDGSVNLYNRITVDQERVFTDNAKKHVPFFQHTYNTMFKMRDSIVTSLVRVFIKDDPDYGSAKFVDFYLLGLTNEHLGLIASAKSYTEASLLREYIIQEKLRLHNSAYAESKGAFASVLGVMLDPSQTIFFPLIGKKEVRMPHAKFKTVLLPYTNIKAPVRDAHFSTCLLHNIEKGKLYETINSDFVNCNIILSR